MPDTDTKILTPAELKKIDAETSHELTQVELNKLDIELKRDELSRSEHLDRRAHSEAQEAAINVLKAEEDLLQLKLNTDIGRIQRDAQLREEKDQLAGNMFHKIYSFNSQVSDSSVKACMERLTQWSRQDPGCDIEIRINSPGGDIVAGFALVDFLRDLQREGHTVTTVAYGMAASMGGVILQVGTHRVMGKHAFLLIHEGSMGAIGDFGDVEDRVKFMVKLHEKIVSLFVDRSHVTKAFFRKNWKRTDWWVEAEKALEYGFCDEVR